MDCEDVLARLAALALQGARVVAGAAFVERRGFEECSLQGSNRGAGGGQAHEFRVNMVKREGELRDRINRIEMQKIAGHMREGQLKLNVEPLLA
jgi:hypothetical protein